MHSKRFDKAFLTVSIVLTVEALVCTQIPLLNYLGYEFSFFNALVAGFLCGFLLLARWKQHQPESDEEYWKLVGQVLSRSGLAILIPLTLITANAAFVKNCSFTQGFRLYILYVAPSVVFCVSLAALASVVATKFKKTLYVVLIGVVLAHIPFVTLTRPQIFAFNPIAGYFPGLTYDESISGELRLLVYRIGTIAASLSLLTVSAATLRVANSKLGKRLGQKWPLRYVALSLAGFTICGGIYRISDGIGLSSSERYIAKVLGGVQITQHFNIIYPEKSVDARKLRELILLHEYLYDQLCEEWRVSPRRAITVFLYATPKQKERLIGAATTDFTKPWLRQININLDDVDGALKHEMVHALLAERGIPFLQVAPNSGLIEGAAVASERFEYDESLHRLSAEIFALGLHPDVAGMFSLSGFFKSYPGVSYVLAGSFCRYLIDRYGVEKFEKLYRSSDFEQLYGKNVDTLVAHWRSALATTYVSDYNLRKAAFLFKRSPVFGKECVRVISNLNMQTRALLDQRNYAAALSSADYSLRLTKSTEAIFLKSTTLFRLGEFEEAARFMNEQLADSTMNTALLPLHLMLGDSYWALGDLENARFQYQKILSDSLSVSADESASLRLFVLSDDSLRAHFTHYFLDTMADSARISYLENLQEIPAADPLARYLLGREYASKNRDRDVVEQLRVLSPMKMPILEFMRDRRLARAYYDLGTYEGAKLYAWRALNFAHNDAQQFQIEDFLRRCVWVEDYLKEIGD